MAVARAARSRGFSGARNGSKASTTLHVNAVANALRKLGGVHAGVLHSRCVKCLDGRQSVANRRFADYRGRATL